MAETFIICLTLKNERLDCSAYAIFCRAGGLLFAQAAELKFELLSGVKSRSLQVSVESDRHVSKPLNPPRMNNSRQAPARRSDPLPLLPSPCGTRQTSHKHVPNVNIRWDGVTRTRTLLVLPNSST